MAPRREPAPYFVGPRCAFVCVCVCLCVYSQVGASCVGRPIWVGAVLAPLRRVKKHNVNRKTSVPGQATAPKRPLSITGRTAGTPTRVQTRSTHQEGGPLKHLPSAVRTLTK